MTKLDTSSFIYGTAWKREQTATLVLQALQNGFRALDTAGQPKHYREDLVGEAVREALAKGIIGSREEVYIQTKFSRPTAQDPSNAPYSLEVPLEDQVHASIKSSLHNLRHESDESSYIDTLLLHSPYPDFDDTLRAWRVIASYVPHKIRSMGISNVPFAVLEQLCAVVEVQPKCVQVRFHPETNFEIRLRQFCVDNDITFQAHKVLKGNARLLETKLIADIADSVGVSKQTALYLCILSLPGVRIVNGTKTEEHMKEDMKAIHTFETWRQDEKNNAAWNDYMGEFKLWIGGQEKV